MTIKVESTSLATELPKAEEPKVEAVAKEESTSEAQEEPEAENAEESEPLENQDEEKEEEEGESEKEEPKKPLKGFKKRIDRLSKRLSEREREIEYWKAEALKKNPAPKETESSQKQLKDGEPSEDDFESHADYVKALARWEYSQAKKEDQEKQKETEVKTQRQKLVEDFQSKVEKIKEAHDDFEEVMEAANDIPLSVAVETLLLESENGAELSYALAKNRDELKRICALSPLAAARELGRFESSLKPRTEPKQTTKAPAPITPVGSKGNVSTKSIYDAAELSQAEYEALRLKQLAKKRA